jgi:hypothetical protein
MLRRLSNEIAECYRRAEECRHKADEATISTAKRSFWTWNGVGCSWPGATNSRNGSRILTAAQRGVCRQKSKGDLIQVKTSRRAPAILLPLTPRGGGARCSA